MERGDVVKEGSHNVTAWVRNRWAGLRVARLSIGRCQKGGSIADPSMVHTACSRQGVKLLTGISLIFRTNPRCLDSNSQLTNTETCSWKALWPLPGLTA